MASPSNFTLGGRLYRKEITRCRQEPNDYQNQVSVSPLGGLVVTTFGSYSVVVVNKRAPVVVSPSALLAKQGSPRNFNYGNRHCDRQ